jgi:hypothetical protein
MYATQIIDESTIRHSHKDGYLIRQDNVKLKLIIIFKNDLIKCNYMYRYRMLTIVGHTFDQKSWY